MSFPVPPRVVRRVLRDPWWPLLLVVLMLVLGLLALPCLLVAPFTRRHRALGLLRIGVATLALEVWLVLGCWRLWFSHPPWRRNAATWRQAHTDLLGLCLRRYVDVAGRCVGLRVEQDVAVGAQADDEPMLVLARHIGAGDSLLVAHVVVNTLGRTPRVMLKRFLLWDAAADLLLGRLDCHFLPPRRVHVQRRDRMMEEFAHSLGPTDALLLFPEGGNWSPKRHAESIAWAEGNNRARLKKWMESHPRVLAPRAKGTREMLEESPTLAPVIVAHHGLDETGTPAQVWRAVPLREPVRILTREVERPATHELDDVEQWLQRYWSRIDRWAGELSADQVSRPRAR